MELVWNWYWYGIGIGNGIGLAVASKDSVPKTNSKKTLMKKENLVKFSFFCSSIGQGLSIGLCITI